MDDNLKLLDGTVETITGNLASLDAKVLDALHTAEVAGKNRRGVLGAIDAAMVTYTSTTDRGDGALSTSTVPVGALGLASALDTSGPAAIAPATDFSPSGAPRQVTDFDLGHPAVDANPRERTTSDQNRIDFNDPRRPGHEVVAEQLSDQTA